MERVEQPCRNFQFLSSAVIQDPQDGNEKVVFASFVTKGKGELIVIDPVTGGGERIVLPEGPGAWALHNWQSDKLLVGTCEHYPQAQLFSLDLKSRTWAEPLWVEDETYIWNWAEGSDGMIYGGTYPGCLLLQYDPHQHVLRNLGRASDNLENMYLREVNGSIPGFILISGGYQSTFVRAWDIEKEVFFDFCEAPAELDQLTDTYLRIKIKDQLVYYDPRTFSLMEPPHLEAAMEEVSPARPLGTCVQILGDGRTIGIRGQQYWIQETDGICSPLLDIPVEAPPSAILTLTADEEGRIWGSSNFGQTIFSYVPASGSYWNSPVVCNSGGEVYGMCVVEGRLFLAAYSGGDHVVYDPAQPWNQLDNINPRTLQTVAPQLVRPSGKSVVGPDGAVWTGWAAKYGTYGGGLSRVDPQTLEVLSWYDPVPEQQIVGLSADSRYLYFTTDTAGNGLKAKSTSRYLVVWDPAASAEVHRELLEEPEALRVLLACAGRVWMERDGQIHIFNPQTLSWENPIPLGESCTCMVQVNDATIALFGERYLYELHVEHRKAVQVGELPGDVGTAVVSPNDEMFFASGSWLYRLGLRRVENGGL
ncbi:hypothetical protein [Paenibacillus eucommiae]|uniref:WD40 repeat domain-containing protein n=1 Tax=Paenibacillus eucommiae TaxID=1355755 RepID=A0ABS4IX69_9BACL|nr:hypothetical protein [Paenibacillus eucommiae]MBP1991466.1 hypothetical protein [Paenibacillus eucommiae]